MDPIREVLCTIRAATLRQPKISVVVKSGVERLDNLLVVIQSMLCFCDVSEECTKTRVTQAPSTYPFLACHIAHKRVVVSPPKSGQEENKKWR